MRSVLGYLGVLLQIMAVFSLIPGIAALIWNEFAYAFYTMSLVFVFLGIILEKYFGTKDELTISDGLKLTAISFVVVPVIATIPYLTLLKNSITFTDALFESISGFTTTGLTVFDDPSTLPKSLLLWRSVTQWIGGIGIVVVFLGFLRNTSTSALNIFSAQNIEKKVGYDIIRLARRIFQIYLMLTFTGFLLFFIASKSVFTSINYALTSISTGGFQVGAQFPSSHGMMLVAIIMMIAGATSFLLHDELLRRRIKNVIKSVPFMGMISYLTVFVLYSFINTGSLEFSVFQVVSALTTTGYQVVDLASLPLHLFFILLIGMIIGGNTNSTAGGIKTERACLSLASIPWMVKKLSSPRRAVIPLKLGKKVVSDEEAKLAFVFIGAYFIFGVASAFFIASFGVGFEHALFQSFSAIGTVGLSTQSLASYPFLAKLNLMVLMLMGRLEIFPLLILLKRE